MLYNKVQETASSLLVRTCLTKIELEIFQAILFTGNDQIDKGIKNKTFSYHQEQSFWIQLKTKNVVHPTRISLKSANKLN